MNNWAIIVPIILFSGLVIAATIMGGAGIDILAKRRANEKK